MKRVKLIRYLNQNNCRLVREGGKHSVFLNPLTNQMSTVPRHSEINDFLAQKICRDLGLKPLRK